MVKLRFMLGHSDTKACALNHCAIPPLPTENGQTLWRPVLGQLSGAFGLYFDSRLPSISVKSSPREDECPGPIHSCLPFFSYNPELPSCLILQAWVGTDHGPLLGEQNAEDKELRIPSLLSEGAPYGLYFPSLQVLK